MHHAITTAWALAKIGTCIVIDVIPIITGFDTFPDDSVSTACLEARVSACIPIVTIAIITGFEPKLIVGSICPNHPISTSSGHTVISTAIPWVFVPVIAFFAGLNESVSTTGPTTGVGTSIFIVIIAIVAPFEAFPADPVTAARLSTLIAAGIAIVAVPVITGFISCLVWGQICPNNTVSTEGDSAIISAPITVVGVAVITFFPLLNESIPAAQLTTIIGASIGIIIIPVVALFDAFPYNAVAAAGLAAIHSALVMIVFVSIIAGLEAWLIHLEAYTKDSVPASG